jgi:siroheme synthase-like protein
MAFDFPVFLDLTDVPVLVVGGGSVGTRKALGLLAAGAIVTVVAPVHSAELDHSGVRQIRRCFDPADLRHARLVVTATDRVEVNAAVAAAATAAGIWVNSADDPDNCSFILPAVARHGSVNVAVSTGGASPALAKELRDRFGALLRAWNAAAAAEDLGAQRRAIQDAGGSTEHRDWTDAVREALSHPPSSQPPESEGLESEGSESFSGGRVAPDPAHSDTTTPFR